MTRRGMLPRGLMEKTGEKKRTESAEGVLGYDRNTCLRLKRFVLLDCYLQRPERIYMHISLWKGNCNFVLPEQVVNSE